MKSEKQIEEKINELNQLLHGEEDSFVRVNILQQKLALKWVLKDAN